MLSARLAALDSGAPGGGASGGLPQRPSRPGRRESGAARGSGNGRAAAAAAQPNGVAKGAAGALPANGTAAGAVSAGEPAATSKPNGISTQDKVIGGPAKRAVSGEATAVDLADAAGGAAASAAETAAASARMALSGLGTWGRGRPPLAS